MENHTPDHQHHPEPHGPHHVPPAPPARPAGGTQWLLPASILIAAVLIAGSLIFTVYGRPGTSVVAPPDEAPSVAVQAPAPADRDVILGDPAAPVSIILYEDFQCPYCVQFFTETEQAIRTAYVDTGKVKIAYRHFPLSTIHPSATPAAEASECAKDQGKFWEFHDALFTSEAAALRETTLTPALYGKIAKDLGLDTEKFASCVSNRTHQAFVAAQAAEATAKYGVQSTPTIFVNDQKVEGAYPFATFQQIIESFL